MPGQVMIVIGASAGGVETLVRLVNDLPADLPAAICVVLHIPASGKSVLPEILRRSGVLPAKHPKNQEAIQMGAIYVAPPDRHLLVDDGHLRLTSGPRENGHRPAIDPLFRTAARAYNRRLIGVILSGTLDDGALGLNIVKHYGGLAVVQYPHDALFGDMPRNALENTAVDYVLPLDQIGPTLVSLAHQLASQEGAPAMADDLNEFEAKLIQRDKAALERGARPGEPTVFTCPECGGVIWEIDEGELIRFRCHVGHAYSAESFLSQQDETLESVLWTAYRALEEKAGLSRRMAERANKNGNHSVGERFEEQAQDAEARARLIQQALTSVQPTPSEG